MNVLIAANYSAPNSGNFIASLITLGRALREQGNFAVFVFPKSTNTLRNTDANWCRWFEREGFSVELLSLEENSENQLRDLLHLVNAYSIDVLHLHFGIFHKIMLKNRSCFKGKKIIMHDHMDFPAGYKPTFQNSGKNMLTAAVYNLLDIRYVAIASQKHQFFRRIIRKCYYLPNALSYERNISHSMDRDTCRQKLGILPTDEVCLFLGWSLDIKGLDIAIKALHTCRETNPNLILCIVGFGHTPAESAAQYIESKTGISASSPWIKYLASTEDMYAYHRAADVYLSASRTESFSYGLLEAISQNTPVAVSDIEGAKWSWEYSKCFHYPVEDHLACSLAIRDALKTGRAASNADDIIRNYDIHDWCRQIIAIYTEGYKSKS